MVRQAIRIRVCAPRSRLLRSGAERLGLEAMRRRHEMEPAHDTVQERRHERALHRRQRRHVPLLPRRLQLLALPRRPYQRRLHARLHYGGLLLAAIRPRGPPRPDVSGCRYERV